MLATQKGEWPWPSDKGKVVEWEERGNHILIHDGFESYKLSKQDFEKMFEKVGEVNGSKSY